MVTVRSKSPLGSVNPLHVCSPARQTPAWQRCVAPSALQSALTLHVASHIDCDEQVSGVAAPTGDDKHTALLESALHSVASSHGDEHTPQWQVKPSPQVCEEQYCRKFVSLPNTGSLGAGEQPMATAPSIKSTPQNSRVVLHVGVLGSFRLAAPAVGGLGRSEFRSLGFILFFLRNDALAHINDDLIVRRR